VVVIRDDHVEASIARGFYLRAAGYAAINRDEEVGSTGSYLPHGAGVEAITFHHPVGYVGLYVRAQVPQSGGEKGGGGHAVGVIVSIYNHLLMATEGLADAVYGGSHARKQQGVRILGYVGRLQETFYVGGIGQAPVGEYLHQQRRQLKMGERCEGRLYLLRGERRVKVPPRGTRSQSLAALFHNHSSLDALVRLYRAIIAKFYRR
jgi:hypothetical protein